MLEISGVGLNSTTYHVDALPEVWESQIKVDPFTKSLRKRAFPFYAHWVEIFGNDRATGQHSQLYADAVNETMHSAVNQNHSFMDLDEEDESSPATEKNASKCPSFSVDGTSSVAQNKKKGVKRNQSGGVKMQFMDTVGNYCDASKSTFGQIVETMSHIAKRVGSEYDNRQIREKVYDHLSEIEFISIDAKVVIAQYLSNNTKEMDLFIGLSDEAKIVFVTNIMRKLAFD